MAWVPNSQFEDDLVAMEPDFNFVHGQLAYEIKKQEEFCPRPKSTYEYLKSREKRNSKLENLHESAVGKGREIRDSLRLMEKIQKIAGTRPLSEHATMSDWEDDSTKELEAIAMMRHFGMMSMAEDSLPVVPDIKPLEGPIHIIRNGRKQFPLITDPEFFRPRKVPRPKNPSPSGSYHTAKSTLSPISLYGSVRSYSGSSQEEGEIKEFKPEKYREISYQPLEESFDLNVESPFPTEALPSQFGNPISQKEGRRQNGDTKPKQ
ncbi:uncharacterized protein LOC120447069 [Drosophila santomea]|uniref:uncharacterized protein LOC120447069 n=1 Tax=Drosophila santomea TaxID=129105 RepID=UPI0019537813|nr:uncharacterized protein LOC120447069 [Drosophila santomea]XP_039484393.1 uncharacterized protein LOC120447069 [Drosophila santomea]